MFLRLTHKAQSQSSNVWLVCHSNLRGPSTFICTERPRLGWCGIFSPNSVVNSFLAAKVRVITCEAWHCAKYSVFVSCHAVISRPHAARCDCLSRRDFAQSCVTIISDLELISVERRA